MKILVMDDEYFICELLQEYLSAQGHEVWIATDGESGLGIVKSQRPGAVLLDIRMPGMNGIEVLRQVRQISDTVRVIMLSAFGEAKVVEEAMANGADCYLQKPMELEKLREMLQNWENDTVESGCRG